MCVSVSGGVIAHAFFPSQNPFGGDMHFDDAETFIYKTGKGIVLVSVAMHESGHALGLGHTKVKGSIMYPYYHGQTTLAQIDIENIQKLYGK